MAESHIKKNGRERKERWPKAKKKQKKKNKAEGLSKKKESIKCLCMPKAFELKEKKIERSTKCLEKKEM